MRGDKPVGSKTDTGTETGEAVADTNANDASAGTEANDANTTAPPPNGPLATLTTREYEVTELVACGMDNREIAQTLYISEGTVRNLVSTILQKLDLKNRTQLAVMYYRQN
jgi:DNA-binding NarL/FixJ family response regulator